MRSLDYLQAWGFPEVFKDVDRLVDVRTRVCRQEMVVVNGRQSRRFDLFWEFERQQRIRRVVFEIKRAGTFDLGDLRRQIGVVNASYLDLRLIVLVPDEDERLNLELRERFARDILILPGSEHMRIDANGAFTLPPIEVTRTYCSPHEVIRCELPPCTARRDLTTKQPSNLSWFDCGHPRAQPWPETSSPTATLTVAVCRNCYGLKWPAWHTLPERGGGDGPNATGPVACLGRKSRRS